MSSMSSYKVPQDVEADDKLLGPFSFRQFIYLIVAVVGIAAGWGLFLLLPPLAILPLPIVLLFGALALPLRKDQPMEIYLAAILSYYIKPRKRLWSPDGMLSLVEITAPKTPDTVRTKSLSQDEAAKRLGYLANISDTRGWAVRGISTIPSSNQFTTDLMADAQTAEDILDESNNVTRNLDQMIEQSDARRHQEMVEKMRAGNMTQATVTPQPPVQTPAQPAELQPIVTPPPAATPPSFQDPYASLATPTFNPYPQSMNQSVITPLSEQPEKPSDKGPSADIINLANNADLSIETIAREANRIHKKEAELQDEEVVISLR